MAPAGIRKGLHKVGTVLGNKVYLPTAKVKNRKTPTKTTRLWCQWKVGLNVSQKWIGSRISFHAKTRSAVSHCAFCEVTSSVIPACPASGLRLLAGFMKRKRKRKLAGIDVPLSARLHVESCGVSLRGIIRTSFSNSQVYLH